MSNNVVRLVDLVDKATVADACDGIWTYLDERSIRRDDRDTWPVGLVGGLQKLTKRRVVDRCESRGLLDVVDEIVGADRSPLDTEWQLLITFPQAEPWRLPHTGWHLDMAATGDPQAHKVARVFIVLDEIEVHGGGTMLVDGSSAMVRRWITEAAGRDAGKSSELKARFRTSYDWYRVLMSEGAPNRSERLLGGELVDAVPTRVVELRGAAGDVWIMDQWTMHAISINASDRPRLMASKWFHCP